jgi:response regulator RpfG family c-di-GMP phosphodiesterase
MEVGWQHKILIVDSDERALSVISDFLMNAGFAVTTAWSAEVADSLLESGEYDLVLVDDRFADLTSGCLLVHLQRFRKRAAVVVMENTPCRPCGVRPYNSLRASKFVNKWRPCEVLGAARELLSVPPASSAIPSEG